LLDRLADSDDHAIVSDIFVLVSVRVYDLVRILFANCHRHSFTNRDAVSDCFDDAVY
jgi:hypothetical protein